MSSESLRSILVAGVGNAWLRDDGFGGEVARRLAERELPPAVSVMDAGTGGLDLAYEVMRGYDALVILDVSRQGGEPGTLYVMEPDEDYALTWLIFIQRFVYRQLMYWVVVRSFMAALHGRVVGWGKLERKATVSVPQSSVTLRT